MVLDPALQTSGDSRFSSRRPSLCTSMRQASLLLVWLQLVLVAQDAEASGPEDAPRPPTFLPEKPEDEPIPPWLNISELPIPNWFPDFDCLDIPEGEEVYDIISSIAPSLSWQVQTGYASFSGEARNEEVWENYTDRLNSVSTLFKVTCPFADLTVRIAKWLTCRLGANHPACAYAKVWLGSELVAFAESMNLPHGVMFLTFTNSRWVWLIFELLAAAELAAERKMMDVQDDLLSLIREFDSCSEEGVDSEWPWEGTRKRFVEMDLELAMNNRAAEELHVKVQECPIGVVAVLLGRIYTLSASLTEDMESLATLLVSMLTLLDSMMVQVTGGRLDLLIIMAHSSWPLVKLWGIATQRLAWKKEGKYHLHYQHKPYLKQFRDDELVKPDKRDLVYRLGLSSPQMLQVLSQDLRREHSPIHRSLTYALRVVQKMTAEDAGPNRLVLMAMVFSDRIARFMPGYLARAEGFDLLRRFIVACQDEASRSICSREHKYPDLCVEGEIPSTYSKYTAMTAILQAGFGVLYLDFDIIFMQDPLPYILKRAEQAEIVVSRDFGSECINTGVTYIKSHPDSVDFMERLLIWLWHHPYEFCQKAFAGLLGVEDISRYDLHGRPYLQIPRWKMLDHVNQFVTSTIYDKKAQGWTGELENIVIYHFLDGIGGVDNESAVSEYQNLNALFFTNPRLNLTNVATPLWEQDPRVKEHLEWSRQEAPVSAEELLHCVHYEYEAWPWWKKKQRIEAMKIWAAAES